MGRTLVMRTIPGGLAALTMVLLPRAGLGQASPYRGLWVGTATLRAVNEVAVPLDENNVPVAPDPRVPTPTADAAEVRLIIHVNGAGQAFLLKDVAIVNRAEGGSGAAGQDLALVTDPRLYAEVPPQAAMRLASAAFDFGEARATGALDALVEEAARRATVFATNPALAVATEAQRVSACNTLVAQLQPVLETMVRNADVAASYGGFLTDFDAGVIDAIAASTSAPEVAAFTLQGTALRDQSVYGDSRGLDLVQAVVAAVGAAAPGDAGAAAHNTAAAFADVDNRYQRFIAGQDFGAMIAAAAEAAPGAAAAAGATRDSILAAMRGTDAADAAITLGLQTKIQAYDDTRAAGAIDAVLGAMADAAWSNRTQTASLIRERSAQAGREALCNQVARYPLPVLTPTPDYNAFVRSSAFQGAAAAAAAAAAADAVGERAANPLYTALSVYGAAKAAVAEALRSVYGAAARVLRTDLPLAGIFAAGSGDPRAVSELPEPSDLGPPGLAGSVYLPADHPTNPFRHRRHPDHASGYDIRREIRLDFDGAPGDVPEPAGYGVDRLRGTYRESISGLHKPLGPAPETAPIGLLTEGRFELNRLSGIDTLNAL